MYAFSKIKFHAAVKKLVYKHFGFRRMVKYMGKAYRFQQTIAQLIRNRNNKIKKIKNAAMFVDGHHPSDISTYPFQAPISLTYYEAKLQSYKIIEDVPRIKGKLANYSHPTKRLDIARKKMRFSILQLTF